MADHHHFGGGVRRLSWLEMREGLKLRRHRRRISGSNSGYSGGSHGAGKPHLSCLEFDYEVKFPASSGLVQSMSSQRVSRFRLETDESGQPRPMSLEPYGGHHGDPPISFG
ncbi:hypothetical protein Hdeb2414_s0238g00843721 [Helianthus debilis subsp. tardiflorus]